MLERLVGFVMTLALVALAPGMAHAAAEGVDRTECDMREPEIDSEADPEGFRARDERNQRCSLQRMEDEYTNPAFFLTFWLDETPRLFLDNVLEQIQEPTRPRATLMQWIPGGRTTDPYRVPRRWEEQGGGQVEEVSFIVESGAKTRGYLFTPNPDVIADVADGGGRIPAIVFTTGSIQGYQEMYFWAAQGLAEAGYLVLTYDVQGQGRGETFPHRDDGSNPCLGGDCAGVPFQQGYNFVQGTRDALDFLLSTPDDPYPNCRDGGDPNGCVNASEWDANPWNPLWDLVDRETIGLAGHSLGASAVSAVGQERGCGQEYVDGDGNVVEAVPDDGCVSAIVAWDTGGAVVAEKNGTTGKLVAPLLQLTAEYFFNPQSRSEMPAPDSGLGAVDALAAAGLDAMRVAQRSSTHLEYTYVPYILPASRYGERVAMYYTLAWFDRYLRDGANDAFGRLLAERFDESSDRNSIGAGTWDAERNENVPYEIEGDCVSDRLSIYFPSAYRLTNPDDGADIRMMRNMRVGLRAGTDACIHPDDAG